MCISESIKKMHIKLYTKPLIAEKKMISIGALFVITVIALILRLQPSPQEKIRNGFGQFGDTFLYHNIAYNLYKGNGFSGTVDSRAYGLKNKTDELEYEPAVNRGPVYPLFLSMVYRIFGNTEALNNWQENWDKVRMVQAILDALLCIVVYFIVRLIIPSVYIPAIIASILYCFSFYNIYYTKALLTESITTFLLTCFLFFSLFSLRYLENKRGVVYAGIFIAFVTLTRPEYILFIPIFTIYIYYYCREIPRLATTKITFFIMASIIIIMPWTVRNYLAFKKPIIVAESGLGYNLFLGTFEDNTHWKGFGKYPKNIFDEKQKLIINKLSAKYKEYLYNGSIKIKHIDDAFMEIAIYRIKKNPLKTLKLWLRRIPRLWFNNTIKYEYPEPSGWYFRFYFVLALVAIFWGKTEERKMMMPIVLLFIYICSIFLPLHIEPRYGVALMPGIICLAGIGIWKIIIKSHEWIRAKKLKTVA